MKKSNVTFHKILEESRNVPWLQPLWSMLYNEGIRGNHLLFSKDEIEMFSGDQEVSNSKYLSEHGDNPLLQEVLYQLICCPDLRSMINLLKDQSYEVKKQTFTFYLRTLDHWKVLRAQRLN